MYAKSLGFAIALAILLFTASSFAQSGAAPGSTETIKTSDLPNGAIVVLKAEETDSPGYMHTQYAFVDQACGMVIVDRYGPPVRPDDTDLKRIEQRMCTEIATNSRDGE